MAIYIESKNNIKSYHVSKKVEKAIIDILESNDNEKGVWSEYENCGIIIVDRPKRTAKEEK